jgi:hypothetical protein
MKIDLILLILGGMLSVAAVISTWLAVQFRRLKSTVYYSIAEMGELMALLARYDEIENVEFQIARIMKMTPAEVKIEIEKGHIMKLVSIKATDIMATMKASVPEVAELLIPIESRLTGR